MTKNKSQNKPNNRNQPKRRTPVASGFTTSSKMMIGVIVLLSLTTFVESQTTGKCETKKCVHCEWNGMQSWCTKCYNSKLTRTSPIDGKCDGTTTQIGNCQISGFVNGQIACVKCNDGYLLDGTNGFFFCTKAIKTNCKGGYKVNGVESCTTCVDGFRPLYNSGDKSYTCQTHTKIANCLTIGLRTQGTSEIPVCVQCKVGSYETTTGTCSTTMSETMNERCIWGTLRPDKGCSYCAYYRGYFSIGIYKGDQICDKWYTSSILKTTIFGVFFTLLTLIFV